MHSHVLCRCLARHKNAAQIQIHGIQEHSRIGMGKIQVFLRIGSTEIIHQYINAACIFYDFFHHGGEGFRFCGIVVDTFDSVQCVCNFPGPLYVASGHINACSFFGTSLHTGKTDSTGGGCDQYNFILESHFLLLCCGFWVSRKRLRYRQQCRLVPQLPVRESTELRHQHHEPRSKSDS